MLWWLIQYVSPQIQWMNTLHLHTALLLRALHSGSKWLNVSFADTNRFDSRSIFALIFFEIQRKSIQMNENWTRYFKIKPNGESSATNSIARQYPEANIQRMEQKWKGKDLFMHRGSTNYTFQRDCCRENLFAMRIPIQVDVHRVLWSGNVSQKCIVVCFLFFVLYWMPFILADMRMKSTTFDSWMLLEHSYSD